MLPIRLSTWVRFLPIRLRVWAPDATLLFRIRILYSDPRIWQGWLQRLPKAKPFIKLKAPRIGRKHCKSARNYEGPCCGPHGGALRGNCVMKTKTRSAFRIPHSAFRIPRYLIKVSCKSLSLFIDASQPALQSLYRRAQDSCPPVRKFDHHVSNYCVLVTRIQTKTQSCTIANYK